MAEEDVMGIEEDAIYDRYCQLTNIPVENREECRDMIEKTVGFQMFNLQNAVELLRIAMVRNLDRGLSRLKKLNRKKVQ